MARTKVLKRKSFFVDERAVARARKVLGAATDAEAIRLSVERMAEMEEFWRFMKRTYGTLRRGSFRSDRVPWAVLDTSVYIGHWERGLHEEALEHVRRTFVVRHSAVVLSELRRGARNREARRRVESLYRFARVRWEPTADDWWEAGHLIRVIGDPRGWTPGQAAGLPERRSDRPDRPASRRHRGHRQSTGLRVAGR